MNIKCSLFSSAICLLAISPVFADAPAPQNLITNGNFEQIKDGQAVGWSATKVPDLIQSDFPEETNRGHFAEIELLKSGNKGAYFGQSVKVEPHSHYRLSLLARMNEGKITIAVGGNKLSERLLGQVHTRLTMFPLFWNEDWSKYLVFNANQWRPVNLEFDSGELTQVTVSFGAYFTKGVYSFDDVSLVKVEN